MTVWVRSQDKTIFKQATRVHYEERNGNHFVIVGMDEYAQYKTNERCLEIIDEIQKLLLSANPKEAFMLVDWRNENELSHIGSLVDFARKSNFIAYDGEDGTNFQLIQPSVLVYEMPKE